MCVFNTKLKGDYFTNLLYGTTAAQDVSAVVKPKYRVGVANE
jgi:hypothetical protein